MTKQNKLVIFQGKEVRRAWHNNEWYYSLVDIVAVLTDSANPTDYLKKIRKRDEELKSYIGTNCPQVKMQTLSGKKRKTLAGSTKSVFRLIQSIPSKKEKPETFGENKGVAKRGGKVAGNARKETEKELGRSIISNKNFLENDNQSKLENNNKY